MAGSSRTPPFSLYVGIARNCFAIALRFGHSCSRILEVETTMPGQTMLTLRQGLFDDRQSFAADYSSGVGAAVGRPCCAAPISAALRRQNRVRCKRQCVV